MRISFGKATVALLLVLLTVFVALFAVSAEEAAEARITSIEITDNKNQISLTASLPSSMIDRQRDDNVYLFALSPGETGKSLDTLKPIATQHVGENLQFLFDFSGENADRLYALYQLAYKEGDSFVAIGDAQYLDDPSRLATNIASMPEVLSKKGLQTQMYADAQLLGVAHTTVPVAINELISTQESGYSFAYLGKTYYLNAAQMEQLDDKIRCLSEAGVRVYLNLLLTAPSEDAAQALSYLYYSTDTEEAQFYAVQVENEDAAHLLEGLLGYLTARYTRADRQYGFAASFIVGYEVNSNRYRNYRGPSTLEQYAASYARLIRLVHTATRSVYANAKIYISLANNWRVSTIDADVAANTLLDYSAYDFLCAFNAVISRYGADIPWSVAIHPYPSDLYMTDYWNDAQAKNTVESPYLTMANIEVLTNLLSSSPFTFNGKPRTVLISEFGVSGKLGTDSEELQAAAFAYAYYKALSLSQIEALIWHRQIDMSEENELFFGLWSNDHKGDAAALTKKKIYQVFKYIDADRVSLNLAQDVTEFAPPLIGAESWEALIPDYEAVSQKVLHLHETVPSVPSALEGKIHETPIYRFHEDNLYGFYPSDSARYLEIRKDEQQEDYLYAALYPTDHAEYAGIGSYGGAMFSIKDQSYVRLKMMAMHGNVDEAISVMLRLTGKNADGFPCVYEGVAQIAPGKWSTLTFPLGAFAQEAKEIDGLRLWIRGHEAETVHQEGVECFLALSSVSLLSFSRYSTVQLLIQIIIVIMIPVMLLFVGYLALLRIRFVRQRRAREIHRLAQGTHRYKIHRYKIRRIRDEE